ncbi:hypothetical protein [Streptomyces sp. AD55]|uniref:hypothetical protein n=1 Tax=Streptomyces sp. AD55 TaxID=3242895 RepID=UPI00352996A5
MRRAVSSHSVAAALAKERPHIWVKVSTYHPLKSARAMAARIRRAQIDAYDPAGAFEAYAETCQDGHTVWTRYIGDGQTVTPLPDTMTVNVRTQGDGPRLGCAALVTVTVRARCPKCGGPRGVDTVKPEHFRIGDLVYAADAWTNPCGHVDLHADLIVEARRLLHPDPADLVRTALLTRQLGSHAGAAVALLRRHGHEDAAALVQGEVKNRRGQMSAGQVANFLQSLMAGEYL